MGRATYPTSPHSYRNASGVPAFPDDKPLFVFDGVCVLCSRGAAWLMRRDKRQTFRFATAQAPLGAALYRHYGIVMDETYLLIDEGRAYAKSDGYLRIAAILGGWWRLALILRVIPRGLRDWAYDIVARNRYRWFGKAAYCALVPPELQKRVLR